MSNVYYVRASTQIQGVPPRDLRTAISLVLKETIEFCFLFVQGLAGLKIRRVLHRLSKQKKIKNHSFLFLFFEKFENSNFIGFYFSKNVDGSTVRYAMWDFF